VNITNVYNKTVINNVTVNRVSYNGGNGVHAQPTAAQLAAARGPHIEATPAQRQHMAMAVNQPALRAGQNQGHPPIAATAKPGAFSGAGVVRAKQPGTMSVVHQNTVPRSDVPARSTAPLTVAPRIETPRPEAVPRQPQPSLEPPRIPEETRRVPEQVQPHPNAVQPPRPSAPEVHAPQPRPAEHEPEHENHDH